MELLIPFANTGDKQDFDEATAPDGSMSLEKGFTTLFELKPEEGGLFILRREFNQLMYLMSKANVEFNTQSFPNWIADTGSGMPYAYDTYAIVRYTDGSNYISLVDNNTEEPTTGSNWQEFTAYLQSFGTEIATASEIRTGINNTKAISPLGYNQTTLGWGQTWQQAELIDTGATFTDGTPKFRQSGVIYTNTRGKPIVIYVSMNQTGTAFRRMTVDSVTFEEEEASASASTRGFTMIVPDGSTYSVPSGTIVSWLESR